MRESVTYENVLEEGRIEGERRIVALLAMQRFGPPDDASRAWLEAIDDIDRLEGLGDRVLTATGWDDLLGDDPAVRYLE